VESFGELCGRTGGDEFLFILDDAGQITKLEDSLNQYLYRLRHNFVLRETGEVIPLGGSIGILRIK
jgi:GGDEF domain-containing protein